MGIDFLAEPAPDFTEFQRVLKGEQEPRKVHLVEVLMDEEVMQAITEHYLKKRWIHSTQEPQEAYFEQIVRLYYQMGYDFVPVDCSNRFENNPPQRVMRIEDTAELPSAMREWIPGRGHISSWEEFERYPWDKLKPDVRVPRLMARYLPEGMKLAICGPSVFEHVLEHLLGYEGLFYLLADDPELVSRVFARWGEKVYEYYEAVIDLEGVGAIFHTDDLGHKTGTLVSPDTLRRHVFPWLKRCSALAHEHGKMFWLHSCGNLYGRDGGVIEELIEEVGIDAFHSFQDVILPVVDFKGRYGSRIAVLGGVDMDKLARMDEGPLREYIRGILDQCMPGGRFAMGSGNSIANFIPLKNYFLMLWESRRWVPSSKRV